MSSASQDPQLEDGRSSLWPRIGPRAQGAAGADRAELAKLGETARAASCQWQEGKGAIDPSPASRRVSRCVAVEHAKRSYDLNRAAQLSTQPWPT